MKIFLVSLPYILLAVWFVFSIIYIAKVRRKPGSTNPYIFESIPQVFPTIGILGTFIGIAYGLWYFDVNNIEKSIPQLLYGLKTAFLASIGGIVLLVIFSNLTAVVQRKNEINQSSPETIALNKLIELITEMRDNQGALLPEIRDMKAEIALFGDKLKDMNSDMTQAIVKELYGALSNLIEEFKTSMSETRSELENITITLAQAGNTLTDITPKLLTMADQLNENFSSLNELVKQLAPSNGLIEQMEKQYEQMKELMQTFIQSRNVSAQNFNQIESRLNTIFTMMQNGLCKYPRL